MCEPVDDIRVGVIHGPKGRIQPVWFDLNRVQHRIRQITNSWKERHGRNERIFFHVTDDCALYELVYEMDSGCWRLSHIEALE